MTEDDPRWRGWPVLRTLHDQWWAARGGRLGESQRPFSRDWDQLLEDAGLLSSEQRREAERDARALEKAGLVQLKPVRYRPHLIDRILLPVAIEERLARLFGDPTESLDPRIDLAGVDWQPELTFLRQTRVTVAPDDLLKLNEFFLQRGRERPLVPIKERSLQIFGDEKRLDALRPTTLFRSDRLSLEALRCAVVGEPLGWRRGPNPDGPLLVLENAATWHSYARWNAERKLFSAVVYGKGFAIADSVAYLADIFAELGGPRRAFYFGDLDPPGLVIPQAASALAQELGWPAFEPHLWSYRLLLELGRGRETPWEGEPADPATLPWLGELAEPVRTLFASGRRLAQEHVGWEVLSARGVGEL